MRSLPAALLVVAAVLAGAAVAARYLDGPTAEVLTPTH